MHIARPRLRADHIGCYGYPLPTTPNLDRLARGGRALRARVRTDGDDRSAPCIPVHRALSQRPWPRAQRIGDGRRRTTLAESLRGEGYRAAAFVSSFPLARQFGLAQGFEFYELLEGEDWDAHAQTKREFLLYDGEIRYADERSTGSWRRSSVRDLNSSA